MTLDSRLAPNHLMVEASAGTGKTYSVAGLVAHALAIDADLRIADILITTFTRNAAADLRDRVRRRIIDVAVTLEAGTEVAKSSSDTVVTSLADSGLELEDMVSRLRRAEVEFDSATIATIHSICNRILALAGLPTADVNEDADTDRIINYVVNDALAAEAEKSDRFVSYDPVKATTFVRARLENPDAEVHLESGIDGVEVRAIRAYLDLLESCHARVLELVDQKPSRSDLLRRAVEVVEDPANSGLNDEMRQRFRLAFIDEAQDTDSMQWRLFNALFDGDENNPRKLIAVGDPKQAIYAFRGADVGAYIRETGQPGRSSRTLTGNQRSDKGVVDALNDLLRDCTFGEGINYVEVTAARHPVDRIGGTEPLVLLDIGPVTSADGLAVPAAQRVIELLNTATIGVGDENTPGPLRPRDVCVLVRTNDVGRMIEGELRKRKIPAVSNGTASVMNGVMSNNVRILLEALVSPADIGNVRAVAGSIFFGVPFEQLRGDDNPEVARVQQIVSTWAGVVRRRGVSALYARLVSDDAVMSSLARDSFAARYLTDLTQLFDLLHIETMGRGVSPLDLLAGFVALTGIPEESDVVARRVESDADAVQVMTIHAAKGLQFPVVLVVDLWKDDVQSRGVPLFTKQDDPSGVRWIDFLAVVPDDVAIGAGLAKKSDSTVLRTGLNVNQRAKESELDERRRLLYVAMTRAEHHVTLVHTSGTVTNKDGTEKVVTKILDLPGCTNLPSMKGSSIVGRQMFERNDSLGYNGILGGNHSALSVADTPARVEQTYRRTSFSGILKVQSGRTPDSAAAAEVDALTRDDEGNDEGVESDPSIDVSSLVDDGGRYAPADTPLAHFPLDVPMARVPGGTHLGNVVHKIFEHVDTSGDIAEQVNRLAERFVKGPTLAPCRDEIVAGILAALDTPLGGEFGSRTLAQFTPADRLSELDFEMTIAHLDRGVRVSDVGRLLQAFLPTDDILRPYAASLCDRSFDIPLAGLLNGSIDALLRIVDGTGNERLFVTDYKTNRLDTGDVETVIDGYAPERLVDAMAHGHYPLQALVYGTAIHRMLRWRRPDLDSDDVIGGIAYFFVRGMVGPSAPGASDGRPHGVFHWSAPRGLWRALSDLLAGDRSEVTR